MTQRLEKELQQQEEEMKQRSDGKHLPSGSKIAGDADPIFQHRAQAPEIFNPPDIPATKRNLAKVKEERAKYCARVRERLSSSQGQTGYNAVINGLTDILINLIDTGLSANLPGVQDGSSSHIFRESINSKIKQVEVIMIFMSELKLWSNECAMIGNELNEDLPLTQTVFDLRIKLLVAKVLHESGQAIIEGKDSSENALL